MTALSSVGPRTACAGGGGRKTFAGAGGAGGGGATGGGATPGPGVAISGSCASDWLLKRGLLQGALGRKTTSTMSFSIN